MIQKALFAALTVSAIALPAFAANSGLAVGEAVTPFHPAHITGPNKGTTACPPCTYGNRPQVQVWVNGDSLENVAKIAGVLNKTAASNKEFKGFVIFLTSDKPATEKAIVEANKKLGYDAIAMATLAPGDSAVKNYKVNVASEVKNTVFVYKDKKVTAKFVNLEANEKGLGQLNEAIAKITN
ncbi:MAG TPA: hypothetical protein PLL78_09770 [Fimbriimonadaceae bacterium]|nr:hypothetical protein [Fimbriimonadaceae bacterium]HRJ96962.1 hypothetical protein [Fimbriimonadaceae bacterium]